MQRRYPFLQCVPDCFKHLGFLRRLGYERCRLIGFFRLGRFRCFQYANVFTRTSDDSDHFRMIRFSGNQNAFSICCRTLHDAMNPHDKRTCGVDHPNAFLLTFPIQGRRCAVGANHERISGMQRGNILNRNYAFPSQLLHNVLIVDDIPIRINDAIKRRFLGKIHRALHAEAESAVFSHQNLHQSVSACSLSVIMASISRIFKASTAFRPGHCAFTSDGMIGSPTAARIRLPSFHAPGIT